MKSKKRQSKKQVRVQSFRKPVPQQMKSSQLASAAAKDIEGPDYLIRAALERFFAHLADCLVKGEPVTLRGIGILRPTTSQKSGYDFQRKMRRPQQRIRVIRFEPCDTLKAKMKAT